MQRRHGEAAPLNRPPLDILNHHQHQHHHRLCSQLFICRRFVSRIGAASLLAILVCYSDLQLLHRNPAIEKQYWNLSPNAAIQKQSYERSDIEAYFMDHAIEMGLDKTDPIPSGCTLWSVEESPLSSTLKKTLTAKEDYAQRLASFQAPFRNIKRQLFDDNTSNHTQVCESLELHSQGLDALFGTGILSKTANHGWVEPLYPPQRDPSFCFTKKPSFFAARSKHLAYQRSLLSLDYLVHDFAAYCRNLKAHSRIVLVDIGAALDFHSGEEGGGKLKPAMYLTKVWQQFGFKFDHIYAYELRPKVPQEVFEALPDDILAAYHWINIGVDPEEGSKHNPWTMLMETYNEDDLIIVKLDVDTPWVEIPLTNQLLNTQKLLNLVDAFYFEHHVFLKELSGDWKSSMNGTVLESMTVFQELRKRGVPSHFWP